MADSFCKGRFFAALHKDHNLEVASKSFGAIQQSAWKPLAPSEQTL